MIRRRFLAAMLAPLAPRRDATHARLTPAELAELRARYGPDTAIGRRPEVRAFLANASRHVR